MPISKEQADRWQNTFNGMVRGATMPILDFLEKNSDSFYSFDEILAEIKDIVNIREEHLQRVVVVVLSQLEIRLHRIVSCRIGNVTYYRHSPN